MRNCLCNLCLKYTDFRVKDEMVVCGRAPEPDDILWKNADKPRCEIIRNRILSYFVSICLLLLGGLIQYGIQIAKRDLTDPSKENIYNTLASVSIVIFNGILAAFLSFMSAREGNCT